MDDVDRIIFGTFNRLQCSFCDAQTDSKIGEQADEEEKNDGSQNCLSFERLSTDNIVEAVVRLLWAYDSSTRRTIPSFKLDAHATSRFRMANALSKELKKLGLREEFGYQSLLYHNSFDVRRLFLALMERLPEDAFYDSINPLQELKHINLAPLEELRVDADSSMVRHLDAPWVPEFCRYLRMKYDGRFWHPNQEDEGIFSFGRERPTRKRRDNGAVISQGDDMDDSASVTSSTDTDAAENLRHLTKPKVPPKPPHLKLQLPTAKLTDEPVKTADSEADYLARIEEKRKELIELRYAQIRLEDAISEAFEKRAKDDETLIRLLENPREAMEKLQEFLSSAAQRRVELERSFYEIQSEKLAQIEALRYEHKRRTTPVLDAADDATRLRQRIAKCRAAIEERARIKAKLEKELRRATNAPRGDDRSQYVRRVLEIVANVKKQNEEIAKMAKAIKKLEHEIGNLDGTLERTFIVVNAWLGEKSESDETMHQAYRYLVRMHEHCGLIRAAIHERAQFTRAADEIRSQIEAHNVTQKDIQLERILNDLLQIRRENEQLEEQANSDKTQS